MATDLSMAGVSQGFPKPSFPGGLLTAPSEE